MPQWGFRSTGNPGNDVHNAHTDNGKPFGGVRPLDSLLHQPRLRPTRTLIDLRHDSYYKIRFALLKSNRQRRAARHRSPVHHGETECVWSLAQQR